MWVFKRHRKQATHLRDVARRVLPGLIELGTVPFFDPTGDPEQDAILNASDEAWRKVAAFGTALNVCWFLSGSRAVLRHRDAEQFRSLVLDLLFKEFDEWVGPERYEELVNRFMNDLDFLDESYASGHDAERRSTEFARRLSSAFREEGIDPSYLQILLMCDVQLKTARRLEQIAKEFL